MSMRDPLAYEGEYGWIHRIETDLDATGVNTIQFEYKGPDGTKTLKTATATTTPADGDFQWVATAGFLTAGQWTVQLVLTWTATKVLKSKVFRFRIAEDTSSS
jgi:hypothetical protein